MSSPTLCVIWRLRMRERRVRKNTSIRKAFGLKVRMRRFELGMTQEEIAEKADLHHTYVGSVERGERNVSLENICALAKALDCSLKELMPDFNASHC